MRIDLRICLCILLLAPGVIASTAAAAPTTGSVPADADAKARSFLDQLKGGKAGQALDALFASSPLWSQKTGAKEQMAAQIDAATKVYGPISGYELASSEALGTMVVREYYLVQHRDMVTRWEFDLVRTGTGWSIGYFGFTDQPSTWF